VPKIFGTSDVVIVKRKTPRTRAAVPREKGCYWRYLRAEDLQQHGSTLKNYS